MSWFDAKEPLEDLAREIYSKYNWDRPVDLTEDPGTVQIFIINDSDIDIRRGGLVGKNVKYLHPAPDIIKAQDQAFCEATFNPDGEQGRIEDTIVYVARAASGDEVIFQISFQFQDGKMEDSPKVQINKTWLPHLYKLYRDQATVSTKRRFVATLRKETILTFSNPLQTLDVGIIGSPSAVRWKDTTTYIFYRGADSLLRLAQTVPVHRTLQFTNPSTPSSEIMISSNPSAVLLDETIYVFFQGKAGLRLHYVHVDPNGPSWGFEKSHDDVSMVESPAAVAFEGKIHIVHQSASKDKSLCHVILDPKNNTFGPDTKIPFQVGCVDSPSLVVYRNKLRCFFRGEFEPGRLWSMEWDGTNWGNYNVVPNTRLSFGPSAIVHGNKTLYVFHRSFVSGLVLFNAYQEGQDDWKGWKGDRDVVAEASSSGAPNIVATPNFIWCFFASAGNKKQLQGVLMPVG